VRKAISHHDDVTLAESADAISYFVELLPRLKHHDLKVIGTMQRNFFSPVEYQEPYINRERAGEWPHVTVVRINSFVNE
jgi:hypothetical protein